MRAVNRSCEMLFGAKLIGVLIVKNGYVHWIG